MQIFIKTNVNEKVASSMTSTPGSMKFLVAVCLGVCCLFVNVYGEIGVYVPQHKDCLLTPDAGYCWFIVTTRYAYDMLKGNCVKFEYTGCGGNKNNFKTKYKCVKKCILGESSEKSESSDNLWWIR